MYLFSNQLADRGKKHMEKRNVNFTKGGMRVGVRQRSEEHIADKHQDFMVKTWNLSGQQGEPEKTSSWRPSASRTS